MTLNRRNFVKLAAIVAAGSLSDYSNNWVKDGDLYLYRDSNIISSQQIEKVAAKTVENMNVAEINIKSRRVLERHEFPRLNGLDLMIYLTEFGSAIGNAKLGIYNQRERRVIPHRDYFSLRKKTGFPYSSEDSYLHIAYVNLKLVILNSSRNISEEELIRNTSIATTHEIGHLYGIHRHPKGGDNKSLFMDQRFSDNERWTEEQSFTIRNYIAEAKSLRNPRKRDLIRLRESMLVD